jgi:hypothetical protein
VITLDELLDAEGIDREEMHPRSCCGRMWKFGSLDGITERLCINRYCVEWICECGAYTGGYGPIGCRCGQGRGGKGGPIPVPQMRDYRRRTKHRSRRLRRRR